MDKTFKSLQLLNKDITKYRISHSQKLQRKDIKNGYIQGHMTQNRIIPTAIQKQTISLSQQYSQSPAASSSLHVPSSSFLHIPSSSFSSIQSYKHISNQ